MLVLMRRIGESIIINENVTVKILSINGKQARIGIEAPKDFEIVREELLEREEAKKVTAGS